MFQGIAWLRQNHAPEAVSALEQAVTGYRDTPPAIAFTDNREVYAGIAYRNLAEALAKSGNRERARNMAETVLAKWEGEIAHQPENWEGKEIGAKVSVMVASLLEPAKPDEAARRQSLLDAAAAILTSPESVGRLKVDDKELLAKIASMRAATGTPEKAPTK